jgi:DNA-binding Lrp family transcriptional regulator
MSEDRVAPRGHIAPELDAVDHTVLSLLTRDGRMSVAALAEAAHISRSHAYQRVDRLRAQGVITGFTARVDPVAAGLASSAYVTLKLRQHSWKRLRSTLLDIPEVHHVALVGGAFDVILLVRAADNEELRRVVFEVLQPMEEIVDTQTHLVFEDSDVSPERY